MPPETRWIQAVALDMDGLTLNTEDLYGEVGQMMMARRGKRFTDTVRRGMTGRPAPEAYAVLIQAEGLKETWQELHRECTELLDELVPQRVAPMPGLLTLLDELDRLRLPRCIATSSPHTFAAKALRHAGVDSRIDFIVTANDVARGKPAPDIYHLAALRMACDPTRLLVLEDSPIGAEAGVQAGCQVIAVPSPHVEDSTFEGIHRRVSRLDAPEITLALHSIAWPPTTTG
jgi:HAD superfamily hydrolase (TIGR01509 family)